MAKLSPFDDGKSFAFHCPGCDTWHHFTVPRWSFNGDMEHPTFSPSLLYYARPGRPRCHLFLEDGKIKYLADCDHPLAGNTVNLPDMEGT